MTLQLSSYRWPNADRWIPANGRLPVDRSLLEQRWQGNDDRPYIDESQPLDSWLPDCEDANDDPRYQDEESVVEAGFWE